MQETCQYCNKKEDNLYLVEAENCSMKVCARCVKVAQDYLARVDAFVYSVDYEPSPLDFDEDDLDALIAGATATHRKELDWIGRDWSKYQKALFYALLTSECNIIIDAVAGSGKTTTLLRAAEIMRTRVDKKFRCLMFNKSVENKINTDWQKAWSSEKIATTTHAAGFYKINVYLAPMLKRLGRKLEVDDRPAELLMQQLISRIYDDENFCCELGIPDPFTENVRFVIDDYSANTEFKRVRSSNATTAAFVKLVETIADFSRSTLTNLSDLDATWEMIWHFRLDKDVKENIPTTPVRSENGIPVMDREGNIEERRVFEPEIFIEAAICVARRYIAQRINDALETGIIQFIDMLYLPNAVQEIMACGHRYKLLFVDEAQDLNSAQQGIVRGMLDDGGRVVFVGDRRQAIQGWAGADNESMMNMAIEYDALELTLPICYRCPTSHLNLAREIVPQIQTRPGAPVGELKTVDTQTARGMMNGGDMVICRTNEPLYALAFTLIRQRRKVELRGEDLIGRLLRYIDQADALYQKAEKSGEFTKKTDESEAEFWQRNFVAVLEKTEDVIMRRYDTPQEYQESTAHAIFRCLISIVKDSLDVENIEELRKSLKDLSTSVKADAKEDNDLPEDAIILSTIHRAKGLEAKNVFLWNADKLEITWADMLDWQKEQEQNCRYVALTRSKESMVRVNIVV